MIRWQGREVSTKGFDLFQHVVQRVVAIGPAPYTERTVMALKAQFRLIAGSVPCCALGDGVKRRSRSPILAVNSHKALTAMR